MFGLSWKPLLIGTVVATAVAVGAVQAEACWACGSYYPVSWGYSAYYSPCYTSCCTLGCDPCYSTSCGWYVGYRPGPIRRLLLGPYRWYYGCWGGYSACCWDTCCTYAEVGTMAPTLPAQPTPTEAQKPAVPQEPAQPTIPPPTLPSQPEPGVEPPKEGAPSTFNAPQTSGLLTIYVPYDAKITVNGLATRSQGSRRQYVSYGLKPGFSYKYEVRAEVVRDGQLVEDVRTVMLTAGAREMLTFGFNPAPSQEVASR
jgi:uncharacterized protein (TIGR03000 family)